MSQIGKKTWLNYKILQLRFCLIWQGPMQVLKSQSGISKISKTALTITFKTTIPSCQPKLSSFKPKSELQVFLLALSCTCIVPAPKFYSYLPKQYSYLPKLSSLLPKFFSNLLSENCISNYPNGTDICPNYIVAYSNYKVASTNYIVSCPNYIFTCQNYTLSNLQLPTQIITLPG